MNIIKCPTSPNDRVQLVGRAYSEPVRAAFRFAYTNEPQTFRILHALGKEAAAEVLMVATGNTGEALGLPTAEAKKMITDASLTEAMASYRDPLDLWASPSRTLAVETVAGRLHTLPAGFMLRCFADRTEVALQEIRAAVPRPAQVHLPENESVVAAYYNRQQMGFTARVALLGLGSAQDTTIDPTKAPKSSNNWFSVTAEPLE